MHPSFPPLPPVCHRYGDGYKPELSAEAYRGRYDRGSIGVGCEHDLGLKFLFMRNGQDLLLLLIALTVTVLVVLLAWTLLG